jgi:O-antigen/teichoic acid export membrane protein
MEDRSTSGARLRRALHFYTYSKLLNFVLSFFFQILIVKILSPEKYATYAVLLAIVLAGERVLSFGVDRTIMRFLPTLTPGRDTVELRSLGLLVGLTRACALTILVAAIYFGADYINRIIPVSLDGTTLIAFAIWFVGHSLFADADALAQSWLAHMNSAITATAEVVARFVIVSIICLYWRDISVEWIVAVWAVTTTLGTVSLLYQLRHNFSRTWMRVDGGGLRAGEAESVKSHARSFMASAYASTWGWLFSSPSVVRIVATGGLDILSLAAFSFVQGFTFSLQRAFLGLQFLPSLEALMARYAGGPRDERILAALSLIFKVDLICMLAVLIATAIAGFEIVTLLSRPAYAPYYFIFPILMLTLISHTIYRIFEMIASLMFRHRIFMTLWPLGLLTILAMYMTVSRWGLWSVLFLPIAEQCIRAGILLVAFRKDNIWRVFDPARSLSLAFSAALILGALFFLRTILMTPGFASNLALAVAGNLAFLGVLFVLRPLRPTEYDVLGETVPASWARARKFGLRFVRH